MIDYLQIIEQIIREVESSRFENTKLIGHIIETISDDIVKYSSNIDGISHVMLFSSNHRPKELTFIFEEEGLLLSTLKANFDNLSANYNHRDNYTEFSFMADGVNIDKVFFIADNKFEITSNNLIETTPYGHKVEHMDLVLDCICIRLKNS